MNSKQWFSIEIQRMNYRLLSENTKRGISHERSIAQKAAEGKCIIEGETPFKN